jgi:hypothetical protein
VISRMSAMILCGTRHRRAGRRPGTTDRQQRPRVGTHGAPEAVERRGAIAAARPEHAEVREGRRVRRCKLQRGRVATLRVRGLGA